MQQDKKPFEIIVLGPPVSGKGTQADLLSATFEIPHISTGQILHLIKDDKNHPKSKEVAGFMDSGDLVPDDLVNDLVLERIKEDDCKLGFVLDGYPRNLDQSRVIDGASDLDYVFLINVSDEVVVERIGGRRVCKNGHTWHLKFSPPKDEKICDSCGEELFQRDDDKEDVVKTRLSNFHNNMKPIIDFYDKEGVLLRINGEQHIEGVFQEIVRYLVKDLRDKAK